MSGADRIASERQRQISVEGWTTDHDDQYANDELVAAAASYTQPPRTRKGDGTPPIIWPWPTSWWKPSPENRIRELEKAGALIAAEIDRLERLAESEGGATVTAETKQTLGRAVTSERGWPLILFEDAYGKGASLQCSSAIGDYDDSLQRPGSSYVWLGLDDASPQIMAVHAAEHGVETTETTGWVPFPIPRGVLLSTRMHLNREQVAGLINRLQEWLDHGAWPNDGEGF